MRGDLVGKLVGHAFGHASVLLPCQPAYMPLSLPAISAAIVCEGKELETYDVKQDGTVSLTAFIASEAGKVRAFFLARTADQSFCVSAIQNCVLEQFAQL